LIIAIISLMNSLLGLNYYDDEDDEQQQQTEKDVNTAKPIKAISGKSLLQTKARKNFKRF
jgi:hypothetical protein